MTNASKEEKTTDVKSVSRFRSALLSIGWTHGGGKSMLSAKQVLDSELHERQALEALFKQDLRQAKPYQAMLRPQDLDQLKRSARIRRAILGNPKEI